MHSPILLTLKMNKMFCKDIPNAIQKLAANSLVLSRFDQCRVLLFLIEVMYGMLPTKFDAIFSAVFSNTHNVFENGKLVFL